MFNYLLHYDAGTTINEFDSDNYTPYDHLRSFGVTDMRELFVLHGYNAQ